jgi:ubiquinone/menaquinone biosynthesis C-methylase UbiE
MPNVQVPSFAEIYERELVGPIFRPWVDLLLDGVGLKAGDHVLDVACGTGVVGRAAYDRLGGAGRVVGVDLSPLMLAQARVVAPHLEWREGSALALPLLDGEQFDVLTCQQGLQFFQDRAKAAAEMRRALAPGGRLALATWRPIAESPLIAELQAVAERRVGEIQDTRHGFGAAAAIAELLSAAGFRDVHVETHERTIRFEDGATFVRLNAMAIIGMSAAGKSMSDEERAHTAEALTAESADVVARYSEGNTLSFRLGANVATARV